MRSNYIMRNIIILLIILTAILTGVFFFKKQGNNINTIKNQTVDIAATGTPKPTDIPMKPVTSDDSFTSIDSDLNSTIILNEDFSDIK